MSLRFTNLTELFSPVETSSGIGSAVPAGDLTKQAIEDFLSDDKTDDKDDIIPIEDAKDKKDKVKTKEDSIEDSDKDDEDKDESDEDKEPEDDELKEIEDELEEPDDEQLELVTPVRRKEILAKYPKLFKDFPYLEKAYYREQQFTELLPTIADAKEAVEKSKTLDSFEKDLMSGNTEIFLKAVKNESPKAFNKIVDDYLTTLNRVDEKAYHHVIGNTIKHTIVAMVKESRASGNEVLQSAAQILNQFVFGSSTFAPPEQLTKDEPKDNKEEELAERERNFTKQKFNSVNSDLNTRVNNTFKRTIEANIDPKGSMSEYIRKNASREALEMLDDLISKDNRFRILIDKLWEQSIKKDFESDSVDIIKRAFLSKGKTLLPAVIKKARNEALRGMGKRVIDKSNDDDKDIESSRSERRSESSERSERSEQPRSKKSGQVPKGMSSFEFLMSED